MIPLRCDSGEEPALKQLKQDLKNGRVAHAYLFTGRAAERKRAAIDYFVQALLCESGSGAPCGVCSSCTAWERRAHPDFHALGPDGNSIRLEQLRAWRPFFNYHPHLGRHQVFLIDRPELLTAEAANSLLKSLEEPLPDTVFLLVAEDERALLPTIVSRCRVVFFRQEEDAGNDSVLSDNSAKGEAIARLLREGSESELLRTVRLLKPDRAGARDLLAFLLADLERSYRAERSRMAAGTDGAEGIKILESLGIILRGLRLLDENVNVQLLLALTLRRVQGRLRKTALRPRVYDQNSRK